MIRSKIKLHLILFFFAAVVVMTAPSQNTAAAEGVLNASVSSDNIISWEAYPGADDYRMTIDNYSLPPDDFENHRTAPGKNEINLKSLIDFLVTTEPTSSMIRNNGVHRVFIRGYESNYPTALSETFIINYISPAAAYIQDQLTLDAQLSSEGILTWKSVYGATAYYIDIDNLTVPCDETQTEVDLKQNMNDIFSNPANEGLKSKGTHEIKLSAEGRNWVVLDTWEGTFTYTVKKSFTEDFVSVSGVKDMDYTGQPVTLDLELKYDNSVENIILKEGTDYTVSYEDNLNAGYATVTITGIGDFSGTITKQFTITMETTVETTTQAETTTQTETTTQAETTAPTQAGSTAPTQTGTTDPTQAGTTTPPQAYPAVPAQPETAAPPQNETTSPSDAETAAPSEADPTAPSKTEAASPSEEETTAEVLTALPREAASPDTPVKLSTVKNTVTKQQNDKDVKQSTYSLLKAMGVPGSKNSITLSWSKVDGAKKYVIYGNKCGKKNTYKLITAVNKSKRSYTQKNLKKGTYYKYIIVAVSGKKALAVSKTIHVATNGGKGKKGNPVSVSLSKKSLKVKIGKSKTVKATVQSGKLKAAAHRSVAFEVSDLTKVKLTVSKNSCTVTGLEKGTCYLYAYAQNGIYKRIKITVK